MTNLVILAAQFNSELIDKMIQSAIQEAEAVDAKIVEVVRVPGSYEIPLPASLHIARPDVDALVVLGYIERGETLHGQVMGQVVQSSLVSLEIAHSKPIGIGIIGPGATPEQAAVRWDDYARAAVRAAAQMSALTKQMKLKT